MTIIKNKFVGYQKFTLNLYVYKDKPLKIDHGKERPYKKEVRIL